MTQTPTPCHPGHLFPNSSNLSNQANPPPPKFPYLCTRYTPINTHSGMRMFYGGPLRHGGSATEGTRRSRLPARYCFLSLVRSLVRDSSRSDSPFFLAERVQKKKKPCLFRFAFHHILLLLGNPGLHEFYVPFLNAIYRSVNSDPSSRTSSSSSSSSSPSSITTSVAIFAHSHLGLSSYIRPGNSDRSCSWPEESNVALRAQIQAHLEFLDELLVAYDDDPATRVLLVGHSIGCWLIQEILKARGGGALRRRVGAYMLFPTISHIVRSPNGRKLSVRISATRSPSLFL